MKLAGIFLIGLSACIVQTAAQNSNNPGKMLFLHLLQKNGTITVLDAKVVTGTPRERFSESGPQWELISGNGAISGTGTMPLPKPTHYDYRNKAGDLAGGVLSADSIDFFIRVPYSASDERINFYKPRIAGLSKAQSDSSPIGTCLIKEVLR